MSMEGKEVGGPSIVEQVHEFFFADEEFASFFEKWCEDHAEIIDPDTEECKLEYTELYKEFLRAFEDKMTDFIESVGSTVEQFYQELRDADPDSDADIFAQIMNATIDFDVFLQMMRETALQVRRKARKTASSKK